MKNEKYIEVKNATFTTGSRRGYIRVKEQGVESDKHLIPTDLKGVRGNLRWACEKLLAKGATHYTTADCQLYNSTQYCYTVYYGYTVA